MKNFVQPGKFVTHTVAGSPVTSGAPILVGAAMFGVCASAAAVGAEVEVATEGVYDLPKEAAVTPSAGDIAFYNSGTGEVTDVSASGLYAIGVFTQAAAGGDATARVRLDGVGVVAVP